MEPKDIDDDPECVTVRTVLESGEAICIRPLASDDQELLGRYFLGLSSETRSFYGPHPFDQPTADTFCAEIDSSMTIRMVAVTGSGDKERIVGYFIAVTGVKESDTKRYADHGITLIDETDSTLAPSVADDYQDFGVGSQIMRHLLKVLKDIGRLRLVLMGGVQERNARAVHFYEKFGFVRVGDFAANGTVKGRKQRINNYNMILNL